MSAPNHYPIAAHLQAFGRRPLSTVLLERDALAYGLRTHRVGALDFTAQDSSGATIGFSRTGSGLNAAPAARLTRDKHTTRLLLEAAGAPAPRGRRFDSSDLSEALEYAQQLGFPVVFKPLYGTEGKGVVTNIQTPEDLEWAFRDFSGSKYAADDVLVEEHFEGETYRVIVIDGEVVSFLISRKGAVEGDGRRTVRELIEERQEMRRGNPHLLGRPIPVDDRTEHLLKRQNYSLDEVLPQGVEVFFTFGSNTHQGGEPAQVIDEVHPSIIAASENAARAIPGLGFSGIDFIIPDISAPLTEQRAGICEINSVPAADSHEYPVYGRPISVTRRLLESTARLNGVKLGAGYSKQLDVMTYAEGVFGEDYASWLSGQSAQMECRLEVDFVSRESARIRIQGETDEVGVLASLAFSGPKGTVVRSQVCQPKTGH